MNEAARIRQAIELGLMYYMKCPFVLGAQAYVAVGAVQGREGEFVCIEFSDVVPYGLGVISFAGDAPTVRSLNGSDTQQLELGKGQDIDCSMLAAITAGRFDMVADQGEPGIAARIQGVLRFAELTIGIAQQAGVFSQDTYDELMRWGRVSPRRPMRGELSKQAKRLQQSRRSCRLQDPASVRTYGSFIIGAKAVELLVEADKLEL